MKKFIFSAALLAASTLCAACAKAQNVGDVIGGVYNTDIMTYLDGVPIPSYALDGTTAIALSDLRAYGFTVSFDEETRRVDVTTDLKPSEYNVPEISRGKVGGLCGSVFYTDITAYVNGVLCPSYNVNGNTCVRVETLGEFTDPYNWEWGYSDYNFRYHYNDEERALYLEAYRFPEISFSDAADESKAISDVTELELYSESENPQASDGIYAGINADGTDEFGADFGVYSSYFEFDERMTWFRRNYKRLLDSKDDIFYLIPWNTSDVSQVFDSDDYIRETLDTIAADGRRAVIRFACEMNCSPLGDSPSMYVKAFRHVADIVHEYDNFEVMWSPNDYGSFNRPYELYYPGDEYVDWIGISCFLKRDFMGNPDSTDAENAVFGCGDYAWMSNSLKRITRFMTEHNIDKPIAVSEGAVESRIYYSDADLFSWAKPRLLAMYWYTAMKFPQVKMLTYFNMNCGGEVMDYKVTPEYASIMEGAIKDAGYLTGASQKPAKSFVRAEQRTYSGKLPLYTYAYFPHSSVQRVEYLINGAKAAESAEIPYKAELDISAVTARTALTVRVVTDKETLDYGYTLIPDGGGVRLVSE